MKNSGWGLGVEPSFKSHPLGLNGKASKDKYALDMRIGRAFLFILLHIGCSAILFYFGKFSNNAGRAEC